MKNNEKISSLSLKNYADTIPVSTTDYQGQINGGDGFECEISYLNSDAIITTVYNGSISRSKKD